MKFVLIRKHDGYQLPVIFVSELVAANHARHMKLITNSDYSVVSFVGR
jgi:hypothetical protein